MSLEHEPALRQAQRPTVGRLGQVAALVALACVVLEIVAIVVGVHLLWTAATWLAYAVIGLSIVSFLGGLVAVILRRGRLWGVVAMIVSALANPLVQIAVLRLFGSS